MSDLDILAIDQRLQAASRVAPNPLLLDRRIAHAHEELLRWLERLEEAPEPGDNPFARERDLAGKKMWDATLALGDDDPLRSRLLAWMYRFAEWRINQGVKNQLALLLRAAKYPVDTPESGQFTLSEMFARALGEPRAAPVWLASYFSSAREFTALTSKLWQRRSEIAQRLGLPAPPRLEIEGTSNEAAALAWIERTHDMFHDLRTESLAELIGHGLASEARIAWPLHLNWRSLSEPFKNTPLLDGLRLRSKRLPARIGPASFLRGFARLGEEWSGSLAPSNQPFVVAHDPYRLQAHRDGAVFASLPLNSRFLVNRLGASSASLGNARRALAITVLLESRVRALKVLLGLRALEGQRPFGEAFESESERVFGLHLPKAAAGAVWRLGDEDTQRFAGLLLAFERHQRLVQVHDEDWFKNPRAIDQLLSEGSLPPQTQLEAGEIERSADAAYAALAGAL